MLDFIIKYWLEVLFGLIVAGLAYFARHYYNLWKESQNAQKEKMQEEILQKIQEDYEKDMNEMRATIDQLGKVVLAVQGKQFKNDCKILLATDTNINYETFDNLHMEYEIYKSLGGNGLGEKLFDLVQEKYSNQLTGKDYLDMFVKGFRPCVPGNCQHYLDAQKWAISQQISAQQQQQKSKHLKEQG